MHVFVSVWSGSGPRCFGCGGRCSVTRRRGAGPIGLPVVSAVLIRRRCRERLGLSRKAVEATAKRHVEASGWMRDHLTKAVGLHVADEVGKTIDRHLFTDSAGRRLGAPRVGSWSDFTRIPGRARSHTKAAPTWETWRLVGTLDGHLEAHRHARLPAAVTTAAEAATQPVGTSILAQPTAMPGTSAPGRIVVGPRRPVGGGVHRPARRGPGDAGPAGAGRGAVGAPAPFPG